jgi:hypothetical protein
MMVLTSLGVIFMVPALSSTIIWSRKIIKRGRKEKKPLVELEFNFGLEAGDVAKLKDASESIEYNLEEVMIKEKKRNLFLEVNVSGNDSVSDLEEIFSKKTRNYHTF